MTNVDSKDAAAVKVFPPVVPLVTVLLGVALQRVAPIEWVASPASGIHRWAGGLIVAAAVLGLGLWSVVLVRRGGQSENPWKPTTEIVDRGPFGVSRNPMYLQLVVVCFGFALLLWNVWILLLTPVCAWVLQRLVIVHEEVYLERKFGETYLAYKRRVRRWL